jgi:hypothetical protein
VDVYYDWVDACDAVDKEEGVELPSSRLAAASHSRAGAGDEGEGLGDDFIVDDEMDDEAEFAA